MTHNSSNIKHSFFRQRPFFNSTTYRSPGGNIPRNTRHHTQILHPTRQRHLGRKQRRDKRDKHNPHRVLIPVRGHNTGRAFRGPSGNIENPTTPLSPNFQSLTPKSFIQVQRHNRQRQGRGRLTSHEGHSPRIFIHRSQGRATQNRRRLHLPFDSFENSHHNRRGRGPNII